MITWCRLPPSSTITWITAPSPTYSKTKVVKVAPGFEDRLYLVNTHTFTAQGSDLHWHGEKDKMPVSLMRVRQLAHSL